MNDNLIRPNEKGFDSLLKALIQMGFTKHRLGMYRYDTPYYSAIEVYGDVRQEHLPSKKSEYLVIQLAIRKNRLDKNSQAAISHLQTLEHPGEKKKIRGSFIPQKEFNNGPEIRIDHDIITFQWWVRDPKFVFSIIEHLVSEPPQYIGRKTDDGNDDEIDEPPQPSPSGFKNWLGTVGAL